MTGLATDLRPKGRRKRQYEYLQKVMKEPMGCLALSLSAASPALELVGAPTVALHLAGPSGIGKTCLCRLAIALYGNPNGALLRVDVVKDTPNYIDNRLGLARHFPVLIDETTILKAKDITRFAYNIAIGTEKGRLEGSETGYRPTTPNDYRLVAFLSGEHSIRNKIDHTGAAARLVEILLDKPILAPAEIPRWYRLADRHHGWFGLDLIKSLIKRYQGGQDDAWARLRKLYNHIQRDTTAWCHEHGRVIAFLAVLQFGYILMVRQLKMKFRALKKGELKQLRKRARKFAIQMYDQLNLGVRVDRVLKATRRLPGIDRWVKKGYVPLKILAPVESCFDITKRGQLTGLLKTHGYISAVEPRKLRSKKSGTRKSVRCILLTQKGVKHLSGG